LPTEPNECLPSQPEDLAPLGKLEVIWRLFPAESGGVTRDQLSEALDTHPEVRWVHTASAGIDHLANLFVDRPNTILTHSAGVTAIPIAEFVVGCLLHLCQRLSDSLSCSRRGNLSS
jgi:phosphoglycerate dehydrogenase-like enzyme